MPRIADRISPVKKGCREYGCWDEREMSGGGVGVGVGRGGERQPGTIPDEMCLGEREGRLGGGGVCVFVIHYE